MSTHKVKSNEDEQCLLDSATTHTILRSKRYFTQLRAMEGNVSTISGVTKLIEGSGRALVLLPNGIKLIINDALYSSKSRRNLLSFKDVRQNGFHMETMNQNGREYLCIIKYESGHKQILEKMQTKASGLYHTQIYPFEVNAITSKRSNDQALFTLWHDRLGHPGFVMMHKIINSSLGHSLKNIKVLPSGDLNCTACSLGKLIIRPSKNKIAREAPAFLERIQGDICGPIAPPCGPF